MSKRIEAVERRIDEVEKSIAVLRALLPGTQSSEAGYPGGDSPMESEEAHRFEIDAETYGSGSGMRQRIPIDSRQETPGVLHNRLGDPYSIKLVYPGFYQALDVGIPYCTIGFPASKEKIAKQVVKGTLLFVYITSPMRRVIGLAQAMGPAEYRGDVDSSRPWVIPLEWIIGPKADGVSFADVGLEVRARTGDSVYAVPVSIGIAIMEKLRELCDLDQAEVARLRGKFKF